MAAKRSKGVVFYLCLSLAWAALLVQQLVAQGRSDGASSMVLMVVAVLGLAATAALYVWTRRDK